MSRVLTGKFCSQQDICSEISLIITVLLCNCDEQLTVTQKVKVQRWKVKIQKQKIPDFKVQ